MTVNIVCACGYRGEHDAPPDRCPKCGGGKEPLGINRKLRRQLAKQLRHVDRAMHEPSGDDGGGE